MDINSIIEMIEKSKRETGFKTPDAIYNEACDDIIEQLRNMSDPIAWESTTEAYKKYITESQYQKFSDEVKKWYKPYCKMSDWQPIDSAEDIDNKYQGEPVLCFDGCDISIDFTDIDVDTGVTYMSNGTEVTHWMPLPPPPSKAL